VTTRANRVELYRVDPQIADIQVGEPVRARTWEATARLQQWVRGRGRCLVPTHHPGYSIAPGTSTLRYWVSSSEAAIARVWLVNVRASTKTATTIFGITPGAGPSSPPQVRNGWATNRPILCIETGVAQDPTPAEISCVITVATGIARVESVAVYELPRAALDADLGPDWGVLVDGFYPRNDVYQNDETGLYGLAQAVIATDTRRIGHVGWWHDVGVSTTSAAWVDVFPTPMRIIPSLDRVADTTRLIEGAAYGYASNGTTTGDIRMKDAAGNVSAPISIPLLGTTPGWQGQTELAFLCEDLSTATGARAGNERINFQIRRTAGAGTVTWNGFGAYEKFV
jgi:hypothetical protein